MLAAQKSVRDAFDHVVVHCADDHVRGKDGDTSTTTKTTNNRGAGASSWWATILGLHASRWNPLQKTTRRVFASEEGSECWEGHKPSSSSSVVRVRMLSGMAEKRLCDTVLQSDVRDVWGEMREDERSATNTREPADWTAVRGLGVL